MKINGVTISGSSLGGSSYIFVNSNQDPVRNGLTLLAAYTTAVSTNPNGAAKSLYNRVTIVCAPGIYEFATTFTFGTSYVDITSMTGESDVYMQLTGTVVAPNATPIVFSVTADYVKVTGINTLNKFYYATGKAGTQYVDGIIQLTAGLANNVYKNCSSGDANSYNYNGFACVGSIAGTFYNCYVDGAGFNGSLASSGTFYNCITTGNGWITGVSSGILMFCRNAGNTITVSGTGKVIYHVGASDQPVNLGFTVQAKL